MSAQTSERLSSLLERIDSLSKQVGQPIVKASAEVQMSDAPTNNKIVPKREPIGSFGPSIYDHALPAPGTTCSPLARAEVTAVPAPLDNFWAQEAAFQDFLAKTEDLPQAPPLVIKIPGEK